MTALSKIDLFFIQRTRTFSRPHICGYGVEIVKIANRVLILFWSEIIIPRFSSASLYSCHPPPPPPTQKQILYKTLSYTYKCFHFCKILLYAKKAISA